MTRILAKYFVAAAVVACVVALPATAFASTISFSPSFQVIGLAGTASVDIVISGLAANEAVGSFDLDITYLSSVVGFMGYTLGTGLGTGADLMDLSLGDLGGVIDIAAVSLLDPAALKPLQGSSFVLGTLTFSAVAGGLSPLVLAQAIFSDQNGIQFNVVTNTGAIKVEGAAAVPEPASMMIYGLAGGMIAVSRWFGRRKR